MLSGPVLQESAILKLIGQLWRHVQTFSTPFPFNFSPGMVVIAGLLQSFRVGEDVPIESELVTQALDRVQTQVEEQYRGLRRQVFRLDEVAAYQRAVVYSQRRAYLTSSDEGAYFPWMCA
jgi:hypothetical protein